jgi:C-terminal processing protease CtpA/Prc
VTSGRFGQSLASGAFFVFLSASSILTAQQQAVLSSDQQSRISGILRVAYRDVKDYYYDPKIRGLNWDARYQQYASMIGKARNVDDGLSVVAAFLNGLEDSHTYFVPPTRVNRFDTGYQFKVVGDDCFITQIRPKTEAAEKLQVGDQVIALDGYKVNRTDFHDMQYFFKILTPRAAEQLDLRSPAGEQRRVIVNAKVRASKQLLDFTTDSEYMDLIRRSEDEEHATRSRVMEIGDVAIWKLQSFVLDYDKADKAIGIARKHSALILDLRGNPGGSIDTLKWIVGSLFDRDIKISDRIEKKETKAMVAKHHGSPFTGKLIVLVDSGSASCAELLARVVQIEHRGTVIGDRTAGAVMEAMYYQESEGTDNVVRYGFSITHANLMMGDGKSLEKAGVMPDEVVLPTGADLAAGRDPVLARAAELAGEKLDSVAAGKLIPFEWAPI